MKRFLGFMQNNRGHFPSANNQSGFKKPVASYKLLINGCPEIPVPQTYNFFKHQSLKRSFSLLCKLTFPNLGTLIP